MKARGNWRFHALRSAIPRVRSAIVHSVHRNRTGWAAPRLWETPALTFGHRRRNRVSDTGVIVALSPRDYEAAEVAVTERLELGVVGRGGRPPRGSAARGVEPFPALFVKDLLAAEHGATWRDGSG